MEAAVQTKKNLHAIGNTGTWIPKRDRTAYGGSQAALGGYLYNNLSTESCGAHTACVLMEPAFARSCLLEYLTQQRFKQDSPQMLRGQRIEQMIH